MKTSKTDHAYLLVLALLLLPLFAIACGSEGVETDDEPALETAAEPADSGTQYEPAYPEDVSTDALSEEDTAQQESHTHEDGTTHEHGEEGNHEDGGDGEHAHDGDEDHEH